MRAREGRVVGAMQKVEPAAPRKRLERPRVAVLGLGAMGLAIAVRLVRELRVSGYDPVSQRAEHARAAGVEVSPDAAAAADDVDILVLAVRTLDQAEAVLFGPSGASGTLRPTSVVILTSTVGVAGARDLGERIAATGPRFLDLPVSGGPARARTGDLLVLAGGSEETLAAARPVVDLLASAVVVVGPNPGDGQAMKTVNQLLCGVHIAAAAEALALARGLGLDLRATLEALGSGAAASFMLADRGPRIVEALEGAEPEVLSRMDIFVKDLGIVLEAGRAAGVAIPVAAAAEQLYMLGQASGAGARDDSTLATLLLIGR
jgi:3-hydroxyisobutyrate dehydrogenase